MRGLFHCKARASYIVCRAQSKRKMLTKSIFFFMAYFYNALWMDNAQVSQPSSQDILSIGIRNGREASTKTPVRYAVLLRCHPKGGGIAWAHPESPYVMHLTRQSLHPGSQQEQRVMTDCWTLHTPVMQPNCSPAKDSHRCKTGVRRRGLSGVKGV